MSTPHERHTAQGHSITRHSPNGIDVIETCDTCGAQFLLQLDHEPASMRPYRALYRKGDKAVVRAWAKKSIDAQNERVRGSK